MKKQAGFTLIELVMVIVILGVLSAVALPKFVNLGSDARTAAMKAVEGSMRSANSIVYAKAAVGNQLGATGSVTIDGAAVATVYGFAKDLTELKTSMDINTGTGGDFTLTSTLLSHNGGAPAANCSVTYGAATSTTAPTYVLDVTKC